MRVLILVAALVTSGLCLPAKHKPNKLFPKKYIKGKDSYSVYKASPSKDVIGPVNDPSLHSMVAPSSYNAYEAQPQDPIVAPKGSTYTYVSGTPVEELAVPAEDSYSNPDGTLIDDLLPPPVDGIIPEDNESSYYSYTGEASERLTALALSSYANTDDAQPMGDVLYHLAAIARMLPILRETSYDTYEAQPQDPLLPPKGSTYTSFSGKPTDELVVPAEDSYSNYDNTFLTELLPPPIDFIVSEDQDSSYGSYIEVASERLEAPSLSSYDNTDNAQPMGDVLVHLEAMSRQLPLTQSSSYIDHHTAATGEEDSMKGPVTILLPPSALEHPSSQTISSSYAEVPKSSVVPLTSEQKEAALAHQVAIPSLDMLPPPRA